MQTINQKHVFFLNDIHHYTSGFSSKLICNSLRFFLESKIILVQQQKTLLGKRMSYYLFYFLFFSNAVI